MAHLIVLLFTGSYPYDIAAEQTFLQREVEYLAMSFERVIVVPRKCEGKKSTLPPGVEIEEDFSRAMKLAVNGITSVVKKALLSSLLYREVFCRGSRILQPHALGNLMSFVARSEAARGWVSNYISRKSLEASKCVFYSYWFDDISMGIGLAKKDYPEICLVSRTHGDDLYEDRHDPPYFPCRPQALSLLDRLFPDSQRGEDYLRERYPTFALKYEIARLGVEDPGFLTAPSNDGVFRLVSCSFLSPIKRIDLLLRGIDCAARYRPEQEFDWCHFGTGPLKNKLERMARDTLPTNAKSRFLGYTNLEDLMLFYRNNAVDLFLNVSKSEGTPVSVMEAISCGIPVVAAGVGGNPEIVTDENGLLLGPNPSPDDIAKALFFFLDQPTQAESKRLGSRRVWNERYNAEKNFKNFVQRLKEIRASH